MNTTLRGLSLILCMAASSAAAQSYDRRDASFHFGDDCEKLDDQPFDTVVALIVAANDKARAAFCTVAGAGDCGDFSRPLQEFGDLVPGDGAGVCRFAPLSLQY